MIRKASAMPRKAEGPPMWSAVERIALYASVIALAHYALSHLLAMVVG